MKYKNTCNVYHKHLDLDKRIKIEKGIENNWTFSRIAKDINKSPRTISYEILKNRNIEHCLSWVGKYKICEKTKKPPYVCNACPSRKGCRKTRYYYYADDAQKEYEKKIPEVYDMLMNCTAKAREKAKSKIAEVRDAMGINYFDDKDLIDEQSDKYSN